MDKDTLADLVGKDVLQDLQDVLETTQTCHPFFCVKMAMI